MTDSGTETGSASAGYDGSAVIDLDSQQVVRLNESAIQLLGIAAEELPSSIPAA